MSDIIIHIPEFPVTWWSVTITGFFLGLAFASVLLRLISGYWWWNPWWDV